MTVIGGEIVERQLDGIGLLRFENCEAGEWLTQKGEPAKKARRRYLLNGEELISVSSIVETLDKPALYAWHEDHGARGGAEAQRLGHLDGLEPHEIIRKVRSLELGAEAVRDEAADRGTAIHTGLQRLVQTGEPFKPSDYPEAWRPWVAGAADAWFKLGCPRDGEAEQIICHRAYRYGGRPDLITAVTDRRALIDYKTGKGRVYDSAHYQTRLYAMAVEACGLPPIDDIFIVGIDDQGNAELVRCEATEADACGLLGVSLSRKRINAGMARQRAEARKAAKAAPTAVAA